MSVFPDKVYEFGGKPVSGGYGGMWPAETVWFVDYDNGTTGAGGKKPSNAFKYLDTALSNALHGDVIYIRPRAPEAGAAGAGPYYGGDPGDITPQVAATNWTIAYTQYGISLIGTGAGHGHSAMQQTNLQGGTSTSTPVLKINAPYVSIENLGIKPGSSTTGLISQNFLDDTVYQAFANSYYNVWFRNVDAKAGYSLRIDSGSYDNVTGCYFTGHAMGISIYATSAATARLVIRGCDFETLAGTATGEIASNGAVYRILIDRCVFNHGVPTGGSPNKYIYFASTSTGIISDCYTGSADATVATNFTLNGVTYSGCWALESFMVAA